MKNTEWDTHCPHCEEPHGFPTNTADANCPHCGAWLSTERKDGPLLLFREPDAHDQANALLAKIAIAEAEVAALEFKVAESRQQARRYDAILRALESKGEELMGVTL